MAPLIGRLVTISRQSILNVPRAGPLQVVTRPSGSGSICGDDFDDPGHDHEIVDSEIVLLHACVSRRAYRMLTLFGIVGPPQWCLRVALGIEEEFVEQFTVRHVSLNDRVFGFARTIQNWSQPLF